MPKPEIHAAPAFAMRHKLAVARELLLRDLAERTKSEPVLGGPETVRDWLRLYCANLEHEVFIILHLNTRNCLIEAQELFRTLTQTSVYPRSGEGGSIPSLDRRAFGEYLQPARNLMPMPPIP